jgi:hypothetical protein
MAENPITKSIPRLKTAAKKANAALIELGETIGLYHNNSEKVVTALTDLGMACGSYGTGKTELARRKAVQRSLAATARAHAILACENLKPYLGSQYSQAWDTTGFVGSLATPYSADALQELMGELKVYYTANPDREVTDIELTAARFGSIADNMVTAAGAILSQKDVVDGLLTVRNEKAETLHRRLRMVFNELEMLLDPLSSHWLAFGFNKPGAEKTPVKPKGLHVVLNGTSAVLNWPSAARAQHYRIWKQVAGVDEDPVAIGSTPGLVFAVNELAHPARIAFSLSAVNSGGESQRSKEVTLVIE